MTDFSTDIHTPFSEAPFVTGLVAHCAVCGTQWQIRSANSDDAKGCNFCGASSLAITIENEEPLDYGAVAR